MYYVYIMTNKSNTVLYVGVTNDLMRRVYEHKNKIDSNSFTAKYNLNKLVYFESTSSIESAIEREKQLKAGSRKRKEELINSINPEWNDLYEVYDYGLCHSLFYCGQDFLRFLHFGRNDGHGRGGYKNNRLFVRDCRATLAMTSGNKCTLFYNNGTEADKIFEIAADTFVAVFWGI